MVNWKQVINEMELGKLAEDTYEHRQLWIQMPQGEDFRIEKGANIADHARQQVQSFLLGSGESVTVSPHRQTLPVPLCDCGAKTWATRPPNDPLTSLGILVCTGCDRRIVMSLRLDNPFPRWGFGEMMPDGSLRRLDNDIL